MLKFANNDVPESLKKFFVKNSRGHDHDTRQSNSYHVPIYKLDIGNRFIKKQGIIVWEELERNFIGISPIGYFKTAVKIMLSSKYKDPI